MDADLLTVLAPVKYQFVCFELSAGTMTCFIRLSFTRIPLLLGRTRMSPQMSHSLSLEVMEMAEAAALLDRLASGLDEFPKRSTVASSSAKEQPEPPERTCCWSLRRDTGEAGHREMNMWARTTNNKCFFLTLGEKKTRLFRI